MLSTWNTAANENSRPGRAARATQGPDQDVSVPALRVFQTVCENWELSIGESAHLLGQASLSMFEAWIEAAERGQTVALPNSAWGGLGAIFRISNRLSSHFRDVREQCQWLRSPRLEEPFAGRSPLEMMVTDYPSGVSAVTDYLRRKEMGKPMFCRGASSQILNEETDPETHR